MSSNDRKSFICSRRGKHKRTPTQAHTSRYSLHLRHVLESVGRNRRYTLGVKIQCATLRGAGACAHQRRTGVVAAKGAATKGCCPGFARYLVSYWPDRLIDHIQHKARHAALVGQWGSI